MKLVREIAEDEVVAEFLKATMASPQNRGHIVIRLHAAGRHRDVIEKPNLNSPEDNAFRASILGEIYGYRQNRDLFKGFPEADEIRWRRMLLTKAETFSIKYLKVPEWDELSGGSRRVVDGAKAVNEGKSVAIINSGAIRDIAQTIPTTPLPAEPILVARSESDAPVLLDGHHRLTAFFMREEMIPAEFPVIFGVSERLGEWPFY